MELSTVVGIIVIVAIAVVLMKVLGKVISLVLSIVGIIAVVWLVVAGLRWMDEGNVRDNLLESNNLFLLDDGGSLITGFATHQDNGTGTTDITSLDQEELDNPNSDLYDNYYKVIVVKKEALPQKTALLVDVSDDKDKLNLFRSYVDNSLLEDDYVANLVEQEEEGNIEVHKETLAFRHGLAEVVGS